MNPADGPCTQSAGFGIDSQGHDGTEVVSARGEIDVSTAATLRGVLADSVRGARPSTVQLDLTGVSFLGAPGLGVIVSACKRVRSDGGSFAVTCADGGVRRTIELCGLAEYLQLGIG